MKIAVIGAGYAGLAAVWYLVRQPGLFVTLYDMKGIGQGASGASTGLLHPYLGKKALRSLRADEAMQATQELLEASEEALGHKVSLSTGILRLAMCNEQVRTFNEPHSDAECWSREKILEHLPQAIAPCGLWIPKGKTVFSRRYLQGLWLSCERQGAKWIAESIVDLKQLDIYDRIILAGGHEVMRFPECSSLPFKIKKGQALVCPFPSNVSLPFSIVGEGHISLTEDPRICLIGSTYEENCDSVRAFALRDKVGAFFPPAREFEVLEVRMGTRIASKNGTLPLIQRISDRAFVFSGLGSRGLLYHALFAKELAEILPLS